MNRPSRIVIQDFHDAALILAGSEINLTGDRTDINSIFRTLDRVSLCFNERELLVVIERARQERDASRAIIRKRENRHAAA